MDLNAMKQELEAINTKKSTKRDKIDYKALQWKPKPGTYNIRIVPSVLDSKNPFRKIYLHYGFTKYPTPSLNNWGESDPIVDFAKELRKSKDPEDWKLAKKVEPKARVFAPIIVRGEEDKGVRVWEFGMEMYKFLLGIANSEDYGDFTDILQGRDFEVTVVSDESKNKGGVKCTLIPRGKVTPITENKDFLTKVLKEQPDALQLKTGIKKYTFDELKDILTKFMSGGGPVDNSTSDTNAGAPAAEEDDLDKILKTTPQKAQAKKTSKDKFDDLFEEGK